MLKNHVFSLFGHELRFLAGALAPLVKSGGLGANFFCNYLESSIC